MESENEIQNKSDWLTLLIVGVSVGWVVIWTIRILTGESLMNEPFVSVFSVGDALLISGIAVGLLVQSFTRSRRLSTRIISVIVIVLFVVLLFAIFARQS